MGRQHSTALNDGRCDDGGRARAQQDPGLEVTEAGVQFGLSSAVQAKVEVD